MAKVTKPSLPQPPVPPKPVPEVDNTRELVERNYPIIEGLKRSIHPLWTDKTGSYYRINYFDSVRERMDRSYFLNVCNGKVYEFKEKPLSPKAD